MAFAEPAGENDAREDEVAFLLELMQRSEDRLATTTIQSITKSLVLHAKRNAPTTEDHRSQQMKAVICGMRIASIAPTDEAASEREMHRLVRPPMSPPAPYTARLLPQG